MRHFIALTISLSCLVSFSSAANILPRDMLKRTQASYMEQLCANDVYTSCLDISSDLCLQFSASYLDQCIAFLPTMVPMSPETDGKLASCLAKEAELLEIDSEKLENCAEQALGE